MEYLFENIIKENFPNLAKEIDFQEVQEAQSPKNLDPRKHIPRHIIITLPVIEETGVGRLNDIKDPHFLSGIPPPY